MRRLIHCFTLFIILSYSLLSSADPVNCPDVSLIKNAKFTKAMFVTGPWALWTENFVYDHKTWDIVLMTIMIDAQHLDFTEAIRQGQAYFNRHVTLKTPHPAWGQACMYTDLGERYYVWAQTPPWGQDLL